MFLPERSVVAVDERGACSAAEDTDGHWDKHETGDARAVTFAFLVDDRVAV